MKTPNPRHLARIAVADLFLDTFPYGAHSTAGDAVTVGLPVLTFPGKAASQLLRQHRGGHRRAEMICESPDMSARRSRWPATPRAATSASPIWDKRTRRQCAARRWPRPPSRGNLLAGRGQKPSVAKPRFLTFNLEAYSRGRHQIMKEAIMASSTTARPTGKRYIDKLRQLDAFSPIPHDKRLWTAAIAADA